MTRKSCGVPACLALPAAVMIVCLGLACDDRDSPREEAAEQRAAQETREAGDALGEAARETGEAVEAAGERAGQALERGKENVGEAMENLGERLQRDADPPPTTRPTGGAD